MRITHIIHHIITIWATHGCHLTPDRCCTPKMDEVGLQIHVCTIGLRKVSSYTLNVLKAVEVPLGKTPNNASE